MRKAILDTSFILTAVRNKLDFFRQLEERGFNIIIPEKVLSEVRSLRKSDKQKVRDNASLALKILENSKFETLFSDGKDADNAIMLYARKNPKDAIATLDKEIHEKTKNKKIIIRGKKQIQLI